MVTISRLFTQQVPGSSEAIDAISMVSCLAHRVFKHCSFRSLWIILTTEVHFEFLCISLSFVLFCVSAERLDAVRYRWQFDSFNVLGMYSDRRQPLQLSLNRAVLRIVFMLSFQFLSENSVTSRLAAWPFSECAIVNRKQHALYHAKLQLYLSHLTEQAYSCL